MFEPLKIWARSTAAFWAVQKWVERARFWTVKTRYRLKDRLSRTGSGIQITSQLLKLAVGALLFVAAGLCGLESIESLLSERLQLYKALPASQFDYYLEQIRVYAQILSAIFSIYFATIGIVVSAGYQRMRRDIIVLLITEQVGSIYSKILVFSASFCIAASAAPLFGFTPGYLIYAASTFMVLVSALALFPLGQRLFNFFALDPLISGEILPALQRHINAVTAERLSDSLANHHYKQSQRLLEQMNYIDDYLKNDTPSLAAYLQAMTNNYTHLLVFYLRKKPQIDRTSYWFPRKPSHRRWLFAGDTATGMALQTSSQLEAEDKPDYEWLERNIFDRLHSHVKIAVNLKKYTLALELLSLLQTRIATYAHILSFDVGMKEIDGFRGAVQEALKADPDSIDDPQRIALIGLVDAWAALGGMLCLETLRRMLTLDRELENFFERDDWSDKALRRLPVAIQEQVAFVAPRIQFEVAVEGRRLSPPKYLQQLLVQRLLLIYHKIIPQAVDFLQNQIPKFAEDVIDAGHPGPATQVVLANLHIYWKLPSWLARISEMLEKYRRFEHYKDQAYLFNVINFEALAKSVPLARGKPMALLTDDRLVEYLLSFQADGELPDQLGHAYYVLAEECVDALRLNDLVRLRRASKTFYSLASVTESSHSQDDATVSEEFRLHLASTVIQDMTSIAGFAILYGEIHQNPELAKAVDDAVNVVISLYPDRKKYLTRMILLSNSRNFSYAMSPREHVRFQWKSEFDREVGGGDYSLLASHRKTRDHPSKIVATFLKTSFGKASDLFLALKVLPELSDIEFEIDYSIRELARRLKTDPDDERADDEDI